MGQGCHTSSGIWLTITAKLKNSPCYSQGTMYLEGIISEQPNTTYIYGSQLNTAHCDKDTI